MSKNKPAGIELSPGELQLIRHGLRELINVARRHAEKCTDDRDAALDEARRAERLHTKLIGE